jgi:hypothetical protein
MKDCCVCRVAQPHASFPNRSKHRPEVTILNRIFSRFAQHATVVLSVALIASMNSAAQTVPPFSPLAATAETAVSQIAILDPADRPVSSSNDWLPDAPGIADDTARSPGHSSRPPASRTQELIDPGQDAPALTSGDKVLLGIRSTFSPFSAVGWVAAAGYSHLLNNSPNYGTDRGAFGQRLGAAAIRASTENLLSESVFAPIFHEDPRYYRLGPSHPIPARLLYAITRPLINRTDKGKNSVNFALLIGNLAGSELTYAYYPKSNRSQGEILETFGGSIGGSAFGYAIDEIFGDLARHLRGQRH